ncbi:hypothetical protein OV203_49125 [Nannocystis sp. ILAH1]|uniref:hypothetical protein n=1 Tax=unclassified Nannocystis TaxID=2627009 RepID=UPI00226F1F5F|nr:MULTISPECIES: hypothetical protein [unclassified Nannocystis]MCY0995187.1 hypothetical protein [Nannocystis sp. ILAH1]MCY1069873.1 hypothetical protein [Nannocystis sp. RBIL2]
MGDELQIIPGRSIGPFRLGEPGEPQVALLEGERTVEMRGAMRVVLTRDVSLFIEDGVVTQVGIHEEHPACTAEGLRLGMTLGQVQGRLLADPVDEVLLLAGVAGLCFSTDEGLERAATANLERGEPVVLSSTDRISWIGVILPENDSPEAVPVRLK